MKNGIAGVLRCWMTSVTGDWQCSLCQRWWFGEDSQVCPDCS